VVRLDGPLTTTSSRPYAASTTMRSRSPVEGSAVNATPERSESTIRWITTAIAGSSSIPLLAR
jgi:hypothetical protein